MEDGELRKWSPTDDLVPSILTPYARSGSSSFVRPKKHRLTLACLPCAPNTKHQTRRTYIPWLADAARSLHGTSHAHFALGLVLALALALAPAVLHADRRANAHAPCTVAPLSLSVGT